MSFFLSLFLFLSFFLCFLSGTTSNYHDAITMLQESYDWPCLLSSPCTCASRSTFTKGWEWQETAMSSQRPSEPPASAQSDGLRTQSIRHIPDKTEVGSSNCLRVAEAHPKHFEGASSWWVTEVLGPASLSLGVHHPWGSSRYYKALGTKCASQVKRAVKTCIFASTVNSCTVCNGKKLPLYACRKFRSLSHDQFIAAVKSNRLCFNCLQSGHHKL